MLSAVAPKRAIDNLNTNGLHFSCEKRAFITVSALTFVGYRRMPEKEWLRSPKCFDFRTVLPIKIYDFGCIHIIKGIA